MKNVCIIPARSGSKGVPGKNIKKLGGVPLLWYTLEAAMFAGKAEFDWISRPDVPAELDEQLIGFKPIFDRVIVTSDSDEILALASDYANKFYYENQPKFHVVKRHPKLSLDHVQTDEVVLDVLRTFEHYGDTFSCDNVCLLQPTSPFRNYIHVTESHDYFVHAKNNPVKNANCLISATRVMIDIDGYHWFGNDSMSMIVEPMGHEPTFRMGRQWERPLPTYLYKENGAIYWFDANQFSLRRFYRMPPFAVYPMSEENSLDINTMHDWQKAEEIVKKWTMVK